MLCCSMLCIIGEHSSSGGNVNHYCIDLYDVCNESHPSFQMSLCLVGENGSEWVQHWVKGGYHYYFNLHSNEGGWEEPPGFTPNNTQLSKEDIQVSGKKRCLIVI